MKKKVDSRIRTLIENAVKEHHRSFFVIVGDRGRDQIVNLHYILSKTVVKSRPSVLWCYKKELGFTSHRKKRVNQIKKMVKKGLLDPNQDDPFELFISSTTIRYCYYSETQKVLGNTFGMCILQDFEAITPSILARTIETVEGGGMVVLLLKTMSSLKQLYTMTMDVHDRMRTEAHQDVVARFNERFMLSLGSCKNCLVLDDELNILPVSSASLKITPTTNQAPEGDTEELKELKASLRDTQPIGSLVATAKTIDQAKAILTFAEAISEKTLRNTVTLTAARGRGKSAALGVAIAAAVAYGYSNIFVTSPSPENLRTLFEFIFKGFDALDYQEHLDYELVQSTNPEFNKAVVRVNIFRSHRQTIQYIQPQDHLKLGQAELVVIDEAAAIPLPLVKNLLGPYLVFMASTINGYEGTGRSLSLKLIQQLRDKSTATANAEGSMVQTSAGTRLLREIELAEPIRYRPGDPIERWLYDILCLDATNLVPKITGGCPHPSTCDLYYVDRDALFSYHKASEAFLQRMMALYVSSHYKNTPDDLQLLSDAPAHQLFVLLGPVNPSQSSIPDILCVIQVCLEGRISRQSVLNSLARGHRASGDLIPWTVSQQYQDSNFAGLSGARVVRIATHPNYNRMGYGQRALELLSAYYQGDLTNLDEVQETLGSGSGKAKKSKALTQEEADAAGDIHEEIIRPRRNLPPLLQKLDERAPERLHYLGVAFGLNQSLFNFWKKASFMPVYLRQTQNELTGEYTCIMLHSLKSDDLDSDCDQNWLPSFVQDFRMRFLSLLSYAFSSLPPALCLSIIDSSSSSEPDDKGESKTKLSREEVLARFSSYDLKRLDAYSRNLVDYHVILDMLPTLARDYYSDKYAMNLSYVQSAIFLSLGLQRKSVDDLQDTLGLPANQVLALFNKILRKFNQSLQTVIEQSVDATLAPVKDVELNPLRESLDEELEEGSALITKELREKQKKLVLSEDLQKYAIRGREQDWDTIEPGKVPSSVSIKSANPKKRSFELDPKPTGNKKGKGKGKSH
eukprot:TRINITY_DN4795_c0_g1_i1.p1 TRINITY_DN4795_c0_g1~~TRINITY_DN4795_c0_g1_i1.p1  ORF type:complete len:1024 (-),score=229.08 TRINITY_DN4795_c0_g1_i1:125-3196(-)